MAELDETPSDDFMQMALRLQAAGHEVIPERFTYRHRTFRKDFPAGTVVKVRHGHEVVPLITSFGTTVTTDQVLPERADLALDEQGCVLDKNAFEERYLMMLDSLMQMGDPKSEHIPDPEQWVVMVPDTFSESPGMVEIGYDANKPAEQEVTHVYDPVKDEVIERLDKQSEGIEVALEGVKKLLEQPPRRGPGRPRKEE